MIRALVAIGCNSYDAVETFCTLRGAERDAAEVYRALVEPIGDYDSSTSVLIRSPSWAEVRAALSALPFGSEPIESLTVFFAGHGTSKSGTYYLCLRDSNPDKLSTSALSVPELLSVVAELKPLQANVIIDACESGGAMMDSVAMLRPDALGLHASDTLGIAFLAACGVSELALETGGGGALTTRMTSYLRGEATLQTTRQYLDLIDLGRCLSAELRATGAGQQPVSWGMNLVGEGRFALNPRFDAEKSHSALPEMPTVFLGRASFDKARAAVRTNALALWTEHQKLESSVDVESLLRTISHATTDLREDPDSLTEIIRGLATSLRASASKSKELFAEPLVVAACAIQLLGVLQSPSASVLARELIDEFINALARSRGTLLERLKEDRFALLSDSHGIANLYFLPLRVSKVLGWLAAGIELGTVVGEIDSASTDETRDIAELILREYATSLVPVSDEQAPYILVLSELACRLKWNELLEQVLGCYFSSFIEQRGAVATPDASGEDAYDLINALGKATGEVDPRLRASPTQLLAVLLMCGARANVDDIWDSELRALDRQAGYLFVPGSYLSFGQISMDVGTNTGFQLGGDVFSLADFREFERIAVLPILNRAVEGLEPLSSALALLSSLLMPDRLPLNVVRWHA